MATDAMGRAVDCAHVGGDVFSAQKEPSTKTVLWGELFKEKERVFLRQHMIEEQKCFSVRGTYQISMRTVWQPEHLLFFDHLRQCAAKSLKVEMMRPTVPVVFLLHAYRAPLTTSWTWTKFVIPLFQKGFSLVLVDFPGFGKSALSTDKLCGVSTWAHEDHYIISQLMEVYGIKKVHLITVGEACSVALHMMQVAPDMLEKTHIFHNPTVNNADIFPETPVPGSGESGLAKVREKQQNMLEALLKTSGNEFWVSYNGDAAAETLETVQSLARARRHSILAERISLTQCAREHICDAQIGAKVPLRFIFPCRYLKRCFPLFLRNEYKPPEFLPVSVLDECSTTEMGTYRTWESSDIESPNGSCLPAADMRHFAAAANSQMPESAMTRNRSMVRWREEQERESRSRIGDKNGGVHGKVSIRPSSSAPMLPTIRESSASARPSASADNPMAGHMSVTFRGAGSLRPENQIMGGTRTTMPAATELARHVRSSDPRASRDLLLGRVTSVKKIVRLNNLPIQEPAYEDDTPLQEKQMVQDVLEASMMSLVADEERRRGKKDWQGMLGKNKSVARLPTTFR